MFPPMLCFCRKPFLHIIDDQTKWLEVGPFQKRFICDQIDVIRRIQFHHYGMPRVIRGNQEYNKSEFFNAYTSQGICLVAVAANHRERNALVERSNGSIGEHVSRASLAEPRMSLADTVLAAVFQKNTTRGQYKAFSFELLYNSLPKLFTNCNPNQHWAADDNIAEEFRRQFQTTLHAITKANPPIRVGERVFSGEISTDGSDQDS